MNIMQILFTNVLFYVYSLPLFVWREEKNSCIAFNVNLLRLQMDEEEKVEGSVASFGCCAENVCNWARVEISIHRMNNWNNKDYGEKISARGFKAADDKEISSS